MPFSGPTGGAATAAAAAVEIKIRQDWLGMRLERTVQNQGLRYSDQFPLIVYTAPLLGFKKISAVVHSWLFSGYSPANNRSLPVTNRTVTTPGQQQQQQLKCSECRGHAVSASGRTWAYFPGCLSIRTIDSLDLLKYAKKTHWTVDTCGEWWVWYKSTHNASEVHTHGLQQIRFCPCPVLHVDCVVHLLTLWLTAPSRPHTQQLCPVFVASELCWRDEISLYEITAASWTGISDWFESGLWSM